MTTSRLTGDVSGGCLRGWGKGGWERGLTRSWAHPDKISVLGGRQLQHPFEEKQSCLEQEKPSFREDITAFNDDSFFLFSSFLSLPAILHRFYQLVNGHYSIQLLRINLPLC